LQGKASWENRRRLLLKKRKGNDAGETSKEALKKGKKGAKGKEAKGGATTAEEVNAVRFF
jgi:hypothetical protein